MQPLHHRTYSLARFTFIFPSCNGGFIQGIESLIRLSETTLSESRQRCFPAARALDRSNSIYDQTFKDKNFKSIL
ncbi:hypothetical protein L6452_15618 [Arctium lappa]|uniref:Uncharacterized protein n=1 Tax=Arctium lappa TaxID=4217 RepID=A0ACB9CPD7_ARCLA|nr:hypothetical protein L6452_15618 [Arctium lappa]